MAKKHGPNKENLEATRRIFLKIARKEFSSVGYYNASTASIVAESGMARGSLYYHFGDKKGLFRAVYEELMGELQEEVRRTSAKSASPWDALMNSAMKMLDLSMKSEIRRIIVDVHTALTYDERLEILGGTLLLELHTLLHAIMQQGYFKGHQIRPLSILIFGILSEASRSFEIADDVKQARAEIGESFFLFMEKARG